MDSVEVLESNLGKYVPLHLLHFTGELQLQTYFRQLIQHGYDKGIVKANLNQCEACSYKLTRNTMKLKASQPRTKKISKLLEKHSKGATLGKYGHFALQKFMKSCAYLYVTCVRCGYVNKQTLISNEAKQDIKHNMMLKVLAASESTCLESTPKKKRKKRKKSKVDLNCGLTPYTPKQTSDDKQLSQSTHQESTPGTSSNYFPSFSQTHNSHKQGLSLPLSTTSRTLSKKDLYTPHRPLPKNSKISSTSASQKLTAMKKKGLKDLLQQQGAAEGDTKRASLADFLSSL